MSSKGILSLSSITDFIYMFSSTLIKKLLGFLREIILASFFGTSVSYGHYLLLKTIADFFSQFTFGNALQANLMPKFTKLFASSESLNFSQVYIFSRIISIKLFILSQFIQLPLIWYIDADNKLIFVFISNS